MILDYDTLKFIWWLLVGVLLIGYAVSGGYDLGVGTLLPFLGKNDIERRVILNTGGPTWEGNQVWLVTAIGAIFAVWPAVYATAFSGFYFVVMLMLFALFFRPVGIEYRSKVPDPRWRNAWDWGLFIAGAVPSLVFGIAFGNVLLGIPFSYDDTLRSTYTGSFFGLLNPFALLCGLVSLSMLAMHGALFLQIRTEAVLQQRAKRAALLAGGLLLAAFAAAGIWVATGISGYRIVSMPAADAVPNILAKVVEHAPGAWLANYRIYPWALTAPVLAFSGIFIALLLSRVNRAGLAFIASSAGLAGVILTAGVSLFPFVLPSSSSPNSSLTAWDASSSHLTLTWMFFATLILLPIVMAYTAWVYRVMRGKVTEQGIREPTHSSY